MNEVPVPVGGNKTEKEIIAVGNDVHEIEVRPITLICKSAHVPDVEYAERVKLDLEACLYHIDRVQTFHPQTAELIRMVFKGYEGPITPEVCRQNGLGWRHVAGRIDMSLKFIQMGIKFAWVYPEAGLHPSAQCELGDVIIRLALGERNRNDLQTKKENTHGG